MSLEHSPARQKLLVREGLVEDLRNPLRVVRARELAQLLGIHVVTVHNWAAEGKLPPKVRLGANSVGWRAIDIARWLKERAASEPAGDDADDRD